MLRDLICDWGECDMRCRFDSIANGHGIHTNTQTRHSRTHGARCGCAHMLVNCYRIDIHSVLCRATAVWLVNWLIFHNYPAFSVCVLFDFLDLIKYLPLLQFNALYDRLLICHYWFCVFDKVAIDDWMSTEKKGIRWTRIELIYTVSGSVCFTAFIDSYLLTIVFTLTHRMWFPCIARWPMNMLPACIQYA